ARSYCKILEGGVCRLSGSRESTGGLPRDRLRFGDDLCLRYCHVLRVAAQQIEARHRVTRSEPSHLGSYLVDDAGEPVAEDLRELDGGSWGCPAGAYGGVSDLNSCTHDLHQH